MIQTERLTLRPLTHADAAFIMALLNERGFIENIGDRNIRSIEDAQGYIDRQAESQRTHGFALWRVGMKGSGEPVGIAGLVKRDGLDDPDIGYAVLERFYGQGIAQQAGRGVMDYARRVLGVGRIVGITALHNDASGRVLEKVGVSYRGLITLPDSEEPRKYFVSDG